jgi:hypothetical protein
VLAVARTPQETTSRRRRRPTVVVNLADRRRQPAWVAVAVGVAAAAVIGVLGTQLSSSGAPATARAVAEVPPHPTPGCCR